MGSRLNAKQKIKFRIRNKISGTPEKPRLAIFKSNKYIYCQLIDDLNGKTLASADSKTLGGGADIDSAKKVGTSIAEKANSNKIEKVVFDRGGNLYHGRVKALGDAAREAGLKF
jgi:large subunit ribosomal protein L18